MKNSQKMPRTLRAKQRGFTLVEMLVVAALIAIFAGLAVFNITAQLEREKSKAVIAEARHIATAMSFAYDDLGFFPKIGLLRYNLDNLFEFLKGTAFDSAEYHSYTVGNQDVRLRKMWKQNYMSTGDSNKSVNMHFMSNGKELTLPWPADQWGHPYVAYFIKTVPATPGSTAAPTQKFVQNAGEKANYAAAIVSYGRNGVPGMKGSDTTPTPNPADRFQWRLFDTHPAGPRDFWLVQGDTQPPPAPNTAGAYNQYTERLTAYVGPNPDTSQTAQPLIREAGSDDRFYEF